MIKRTRHAKWGGSVKFRLQCDSHMKDDKDWLQVKDFLGSKQFNILIGKIKNYKEVVIKFGSVEEMNHEYTIAKTAYDKGIPNFIRQFSCNDSVKDIQHRNFYITSEVCNGSDSEIISMIIMPFYPMGNLESYHWKRSNFDTLKNVLKQVVSALLYAFQQFHFVHGDMHVGNILLRSSKKTEVSYGEVTLPVDGIYPMIMDFGRSYTDEYAVADVYRNIERLLTIVIGMDNSDLALSIDLTPLEHLRRAHQPIDDDVYYTIYKIIDSMKIRYAHSELPPNPFKLT
jgi:hypothetical protein